MKEENILLSTYHSVRHCPDAKLADFGLAAFVAPGILLPGEILLFVFKNLRYPAA